VSQIPLTLEAAP